MTLLVTTDVLHALRWEGWEQLHLSRGRGLQALLQPSSNLQGWKMSDKKLLKLPLEACSKSESIPVSTKTGYWTWPLCCFCDVGAFWRIFQANIACCMVNCTKKKNKKLRERHRCFALMSDPADSCCQLTSSGGEPWTIPEASRDINTLSQEEHKVYILKFWDWSTLSLLNLVELP